MKLKKITSLLLAAVLAATTLAGCGAASDDPSAPVVGYPNEEGYAEGYIKDTMHTEFFDFTVNDAYTCDSYEGYTPAEGNRLLVVNLTIKNTFSESIEMYDNDFEVEWDDDADDAYSWPITYGLKENETIGSDMLPGTYSLSRNESRTGILVYEVPVGFSYFAVVYLTYYADDTTGDIFLVYFETSDR